MTGPERGFLLLSSHLGDPERKPLSVPQLRKLARRAQNLPLMDAEGELTRELMVHIGYSAAEADRILQLLCAQQQLDWYANQGRRRGCYPLARIHRDYPRILKEKLGWDAPGCLWAKGDISILHTPMISLVGSRELRAENRQFAREVGRQAALQGYTLVSGNARGADKTAQDACLEMGGRVISVVADELEQHPEHPRILYISEDGYELPFSTTRALSRNRVIHCLGWRTFVAQTDLYKGGTWDGTLFNLRRSLSPVFCYNDSGAGALELQQMGAQLIDMEELSDFNALAVNTLNFLDQ